MKTISIDYLLIGSNFFLLGMTLYLWISFYSESISSKFLIGFPIVIFLFMVLGFRYCILALRKQFSREVATSKIQKLPKQKLTKPKRRKAV